MRPKRSIYFLGLLVLPLPLLAFLQNTHLGEPIQGFSMSVVKPALIAGDSAVEGIENARSTLIQFWKAFRSQGQNEQRISELENELRKYHETIRENDRLRKLLEFRQATPTKTVAARVIGWDPSPGRKIIILDKGYKEGIKKDMAVVVPEGLIGRVLEVGGSISKVILLIDPNARVSAMAEESRAQGVVAGDGSSRLKMNYLELDSNATVDEIVLTSGMSEIFPKGIRIGKIISLSRHPNGLHLEAQVDSFVKFSKLEEVLCLVYSPSK